MLRLLLGMTMWVGAALTLLVAAGPSAADDRTRSFNAPADRVWTVTRSTLISLGWKVDKEDRDVGWIVTKSRGVDHEDFGVYAKGTKHRLRVVVKSEQSGWTSVTIERRLYREERILFVDKEQDIETKDYTVGKGILDAVSASL